MFLIVLFSKIIQAHLILSVPQPWNELFFLLVGVVLRSQDLGARLTDCNWCVIVFIPF